MTLTTTVIAAIIVALIAAALMLRAFLRDEEGNFFGSGVIAITAIASIFASFWIAFGIGLSAFWLVIVYYCLKKDDTVSASFYAIVALVNIALVAHALWPTVFTL